MTIPLYSQQAEGTGIASRKSMNKKMIRDLGLVFISIAFLPFSLILTVLAKLLTFVGLKAAPEPTPAIYQGQQVKVLVTGVSMAKGLFLARTMYLGGCIVIGADFEDKGIPACGRYSKACERFYQLRTPRNSQGKRAFFDQMQEIIRTEQIDIWISCSGVATAIEDAQLIRVLENTSKCRCFQFNEEATYLLDDKFQFMQTTARLGLQAPEWFFLDSKTAVSDAIAQVSAKEKRHLNREYILKNVAMDDKTRGSLPLLHSNDLKELRKVLNTLDVRSSKWIMQQFIPGHEEYCTQALIVHGQVKAFVSCPSESILLHYGQVESKSITNNAMLNFTQKYAAGLREQYKDFTGHLSFDFLALSSPSKQGLTKTFLPIECNPRCHTAVVRFRGKEKELASAYLSILPGFETDELILPDVVRHFVSYHWIAHDLISLYLLPLFQCLVGSITVLQVLNQHIEFWKLLLFGKDPTFEWWDPVPWLILNHVYWPARFLDVALNGIQWSQVNVSTGKLFEV